MPKIVDHEQYRKELLWKCFDLFAQKGYASITMREIAKGIGVSTGTLYHYFPSKEVLFLQLVEEQTHQDILDFFAQAGDGSSKSLSDKIETLFNFIGKNEEYFFKQTLLSFGFYQQQGRDEVISNQTLKRAYDETKDAIAEYLDIQDPAIIEFIMSQINGALTVRMFAADAISYTQQGELLAKMLTAYLSSQKSKLEVN